MSRLRQWPGMQQIPLDLMLETPAKLDDFQVGDNAALLTWLSQWQADQATNAYLWGEAGSGKSHLLKALAGHAHGQGCQVLLLDAQGLHSLDGTDAASSPTLVLVDDVQTLDDMQQHWVFNMFIESAQAQAPGQAPVRLVAAGTCPPVDLAVREDLRTRLGWGLVFALQPLSEEGVRQVLVREGARRGLRWADGVLPYMLTRFSRNLADLMPVLAQLDRFSLAQQRVVTIPLLKQMMSQDAAETLP